MDPKWLIVKAVTQKGCNVKLDAVIDKVGLVPHHLEPLLNVTELTILCASICKLEELDPQLRETLLYKQRV